MFLAVQLNPSISGTCFFLEAQLREITISAISARRGSNSLSACIHVILKPCWRYALLTCLIPSSMFFTFIFFKHTSCGRHNVSGGMVTRNTMPLMCMRSQHGVTFLYLSRMPLGTFVTMIGSTFCTLWLTFFLTDVANWVHRCPHPYHHLLTQLGYSLGCCHQPHVGFTLLVCRWYAVIALRDQLF